MSDYISRDVAIIEFMDNDIDHIQAPNGKEAVQILSDIPAADVVPVVHGRWVKKKDSDLFYCSECDLPSMHKWQYCERCGAKMDGGDEHE